MDSLGIIENNLELEQDKLKEECGVFGVFSNNDLDVSKLTYYGLYALQHRGQESAGIVCSDGENLICEKNMGLVRDIFDENMLNRMKGTSSIGHVRYSTSGHSEVKNAQPLLSSLNSREMAIAHNGNLVNADLIRETLKQKGEVLETDIDSEVIIKLICASEQKVEKAVIDALKQVKGAYSIVMLTKDKLIGARDKNGIRPLCIGTIENSYVIASESCALEAVGAEFLRDVKPGEIVIIDKNGLKSISFASKNKKSTCIFEYIYFARPDSTIDGVNVYTSRELAGSQLYKESSVEADVVIGVPESGIPAALGFSKASGIPFEIGFVKNQYIGRSFIQPSKEIRERFVSLKLMTIKRNIQGKRVVLIDDSIVRGTTSKRLVDILRKAGAKEVHFRAASPVVKYPCYFGIDTKSKKELIGAKCDVEEIKKEIGADSLGYLSISGLYDVLGKNNGFCLGCFDGKYPMTTPMEKFI